MGGDGEFSVRLLNLQIGRRGRDTQGVIIDGVDDHDRGADGLPTVCDHGRRGAGGAEEARASNVITVGLDAGLQSLNSLVSRGKQYVLLLRVKNERMLPTAGRPGDGIITI
jgi:hypothetical protein